MKTKKYNTWKFEELSEQQQEKVLENYRFFNVEDGFWYDYDGKTGFTTKELQRMKVNPSNAPCDLLAYKKVYFSIDREWYIQFVDADFSDDEIARKFLRVEKSLWDRTFWKINECPSRYGNTRLEWEWDGDNTPTKRQEEILDRAVEIFSDKIEEALKGLEKEYYYQISDEAVKEALIANDYDFTADGKID